MGKLGPPILALHLETQEPRLFDPWIHDGAPKVPCKEAIARNATKRKDGMIHCLA